MDPYTERLHETRALLEQHGPEFNALHDFDEPSLRPRGLAAFVVTACADDKTRKRIARAVLRARPGAQATLHAAAAGLLNLDAAAWDRLCDPMPFEGDERVVTVDEVRTMLDHCLAQGAVPARWPEPAPNAAATRTRGRRPRLAVAHGGKKREKATPAPTPPRKRGRPRTKTAAADATGKGKTHAQKQAKAA